MLIRRAGPGDAAALRAIAAAAYEKYVPRIGRPPAPMTADYERPVAAGQAWAAVEDGHVVGFATRRQEHDGFRRVFFRKSVA